MRHSIFYLLAVVGIALVKAQSGQNEYVKILLTTGDKFYLLSEQDPIIWQPMKPGQIGNI